MLALADGSNCSGWALAYGLLLSLAHLRAFQRIMHTRIIALTTNASMLQQTRQTGYCCFGLIRVFELRRAKSFI